MRNKALQAVEQYQMLPQGSRVTVALSGGADSVALLHFLCSLQKERMLGLQACHINHLLRAEESERDEAFVRKLCEDWRVPLKVYRENVAAGAKNAGESVELFGRRVRYQRLFQAADGGLVATAHTLSDRAETTFINLLRGTGLKGLCSIPPVQGKVIRPLIFCTREQIESYCQENEIRYVTDSTNFSADYTRNRVRQTVIPALQAIQPSFYPLYSPGCWGIWKKMRHFWSRRRTKHLKKRSRRPAWMPGYWASFLWRFCFGYCAVILAAIRFPAKRSRWKRRSGCCGKRGDVSSCKRIAGWNGTQGFFPSAVMRANSRWAPLEVGPGKLPENSLASGCLRLLNCEQFTNLQKRECNILKKTIDYDKIYGRLFLRQKKEGDYLRLAHRKVGKPVAEMVE